MLSRCDTQLSEEAANVGLITALCEQKMEADATGTAMTAGTSLSTHYGNLVFGWRSRRGRPALMRSFLPCETSGSASFSASLFTPAPHMGPADCAYGHTERLGRGLTTARNERCDKEKQVAVNCRKPQAKPVWTWLLSGQSHALRVPTRVLCQKKREKRKSWSHLGE